MDTLKILTLLSLTLLLGCGSTNKVTNTDEVQSSDNKAQEVVRLAKKLVEQQRKLQPNSWDVSLEESFNKENPLNPPYIALRSGTPPKLNKPNYWDAGLWNCRKLKVGKLFCDPSSSEHMVAQHFAESADGKITGQVVVFAPNTHTLVASCTESAGMEISIGTRLNSKLYGGSELVVRFNNEQAVKYRFNSVKPNLGTVSDTKQLLAQLMANFTSMEIGSSSEDNQPNKNARFIVKNFPKAWEVACGWHLEYDANTV